METSTSLPHPPVMVERLKIERALIDSWSPNPGLLLKMLIGTLRFVPAGRGRISRWIGRSVLKNARQSSRTANGAIIAIDSRNLETYVQNALGADQVDPILRAIIALLESSGGSGPLSFFDIGANAGFMSLSVAKHFGKRVAIYAFEPQPVLAERVAISAGLNGFNNLQVFQTLLGDKNGQSDLFVPTLGVMASAVWYDASTPGVTAVRCPIQRLDDLVTVRGIAPPQVIKIDVEGAERLVLQGAQALLATTKPRLLFESWSRTEKEKAERQKLLELISSATAYEFYALRDDHFEPLKDRLDATAVDIAAFPSGEIPPERF